AWKLLGLSGEGSGSRGEVVELGWNERSWWESGWQEIRVNRARLKWEGRLLCGFWGLYMVSPWG
nr:hypothetical protein [Tanacetum cinerariifolium]